MKPKTQLTLRRWFDVATYAAIATSAILLARPQLLDFSEQWIRYQPPTEQAAIGFIAFVALIALGRGQWTGCLKPRRWLRYPPHLIAVLLGLAVLWIAQSFSQQADTASNTAAVLAGTPFRAGTFLFCVLSALIWTCSIAWRSASRESYETAPEDLYRQDSEAANIQKLLNWIANDDPVTDSRLAQHGHDRVAMRIAQRIIDDSNASVVLIGSIGSGKSTICELTRVRLAETCPSNRTILFERISMWPFAFADSAIEAILEQAIERLRSEVDTLAIAGIPETYSRALNSEVPGLAGTLDAIRHRGEPRELLDRINDVATAAGLEVVLWIEDLERFARSQESADLRQVGQVHSLLYELGSLSAVRVVIASASILEHVDPAKIARYIEHVPRIDAAENWATISRVRDWCISQGPAWIDSAHAEARSHIATLRVSLTELMLDDELDRRRLGYRAALAVAADTPRTLKLGLRRALEVWRALRGEVDVDDVLAMSLVAAVSPRVFSFIDGNINRFRNGPPKSFDRPNATDEARDEEFLTAFEVALASIPDSRSRAAVRALIEFVFPTLTTGANENLDRPQGFASGGPRDYWERFTAQAPVDVTESDQAVLSALAAWEAGDDGRLLELIDDKAQAAATGLFGRRLTEARVYGCLRALCARFSTNPNLNTDSISSKLLVVRSMLYGRRRRLLDLAAAATDGMGFQRRGDLRVAYSVLQVFANDEDGWYAGEYDNASRERIKQAARDSLIRACSSADAAVPVRMTITLGPWELYRFVRASSLQTRGPLRTMPFEGWPLVSELLINLASDDFATYMPHLLAFVTISLETATLEGGERRYAADQAVLELLFDAVRIRDLVTSHTELPTWPVEFQRRMAALRGHFDSRSA